MREFSFDVKLLGRGLRRDYRQKKNSGSLEQLFNAEPFGDRLITWQPAVNPFSADVIAAHSVALSYPYPQLFKGSTYWLLADAQRIFIVHPEDWTLTELTLYDYNAKDSIGSVTYTGMPWQFLDFGETWMLFNGISTVFHTGAEKLLGRPDVVYVQSDVYIETGCAFRGRALLAGFLAEAFWNDDWKAFFRSWAGKEKLGLSLDMEIAGNQVWWSSVGGGDLLWLFYPDLYVEGYIRDDNSYSNDKPLIFEYLRRNECGFATMPWQGRVRTLLPLSNAVVVYGDHGVSALAPYSEPHPGFGVVNEISGLPPDLGIASYRAAAGSEQMHVFVDGEGSLWTLTADLKAQKLGYKEFFVDMLGDVIMVNYSPEEHCFYVGNLDTTYKLRADGLCEINQVITSTGFADGGEIAFCSDAGYNDRRFLLTTDVVDFGIRGLKSVNSVEVDYAGDAVMYVSLHHRRGRSGSFNQTAWRALNSEGWARIPCTADEFKIALKCEDFALIEPPSDVTVEYSIVDKRNIRRQYAYSADQR